MKPTRMISPPGMYFVTFITWQRRTLFVVEPYACLFLKTLYCYKWQGRFQLHAFVVMPEHVHLLLTPVGGVTLERAIQLIKGGYSHVFGREFRRGRFGKEDLPIIESGMRTTLSGIGITFIKIR